MSKAEDQLDTGGIVTDLVFDDDHHKRRSWRFCDSRIPRSEVVYFTQVFVIVLFIIVSQVSGSKNIGRFTLLLQYCSTRTIRFLPSPS